MSSPSRSFNGHKTRRPINSYKGSYDKKVFEPTEYTYVNGYNCVRVSPERDSYFYRMDKRLGFTSNEKAHKVFGTSRNTYFGIQPADIIDAYKTHTHLYVVTPNTPIVLIDMGVLENVEKLMESAPLDVATSIRIAFPIKGDVVTRASEPPSEHGGVDHDRRVLEYICSLPDIDGYYVAADGLHPEIGFCGKSLPKLDVVTMFFVRPEVQQRKEPNNTRKRGRWNNESPPSKNPRGPFGKLSFGNNNVAPSPPPISRRGPLFFDNLEGGKRKHRKTTQKKRKT